MRLPKYSFSDKVFGVNRWASRIFSIISYSYIAMPTLHRDQKLFLKYYILDLGEDALDLEGRPVPDRFKRDRVIPCPAGANDRYDIFISTSPKVFLKPSKVLETSEG